MGKESGEWEFYSDEGDLNYVGNYREGEPVGIWYSYFKGKKKVYKKYRN